MKKVNKEVKEFSILEKNSVELECKARKREVRQQFSHFNWKDILLSVSKHVTPNKALGVWLVGLEVHLD